MDKMKEVFYELQKKSTDGKRWLHRGYFKSYEKLQEAFIYKDGLFKSEKHYFKAEKHYFKAEKHYFKAEKHYFKD